MADILTLAVKEFRDGYRNRWMITMTLVMIGLALALVSIGSAPVGSTKISPLAVTVVSLSSLCLFFIPLIALLLSYDSIVGEDERGTLTLLLVYPVSRTAITLGKFLGQFLLLTFVIVVGFGVAVLTLVLQGDIPFLEQQWTVFFKLVLSSILLGANFLAVGILLSAWMKERGAAAAGAIGVWLLFVVLFDMALMGLLSAADSNMLSDTVIKWVMVANPADAYRMYNLTSSADTALLSGMAGLRGDQGISEPALLGLLVSWIIFPLTAASVVFRRRSL